MNVLCIGGPKHGEIFDMPQHRSWEFPIREPCPPLLGEEVYSLLECVLWGKQVHCLVHESCVSCPDVLITTIQTKGRS